MALKPFDAEDLKRILADTIEDIDALSDSSWVNELSDNEVLLAINRGTTDLKKQVGKQSKSVVVLIQLAKSPQIDVRCEVGRNISLPSDVIIDFAKSKSSKLRESVAFNTATPADILNDLAKDKQREVRKAVAENLASAPDILTNLARDSEWMVRQSVAMNSSTPKGIIEILSKDSNIIVQLAAEKSVSKNAIPAGCFIATAAMGSLDAPEVKWLRRFRNQFLLTNGLGCEFVKIYCKYSPGLAEWIKKSPNTRMIVKWLMIIPLALAARILFYFTKK